MTADTPIVEAIWESLMRSGATMQPDVGLPNLMMALQRYGHRVPQPTVEDVLSRWVDYRAGGDFATQEFHAHWRKPSSNVTSLVSMGWDCLLVGQTCKSQVANE